MQINTQSQTQSLASNMKLDMSILKSYELSCANEMNTFDFCFMEVFVLFFSRERKRLYDCREDYCAMTV